MKRKIMCYTTLGGIQRDFTGFRELVLKKRIPILVMDDEENEDVALFLPHGISEQLDGLLRDIPGYEGKRAHWPYGEGFTEEQFDQIPAQLRECGMVGLGAPEPRYYNWYGLLSVELVELLLEIRPDWRDSIDWEGLVPQEE